MNSGPGGTKKPALCRYFVAGGSCFYGNECQFAHHHGSATATTISNNNLNILDELIEEESGVSGSQPSSTGTSRLHFLTTSPTTRNDFNSIVPHLRSKSVLNGVGHPSKLEYMNAYTPQNGYLPESKLSTYINLPVSSGSVNRTDKYSLSTPQDKLSIYSPHQNISPLQLANSLTALALDSTPNPAANEFVPRSVTPVGGSNVPEVTANSPYLGFDVNSLKSANEIPFMNCSQGVAEMSPLLSPSITPTHSPLLKRRIHSPLTYSNTTDEFIPTATSATIQKNVDGTTYFYPAENGVPHSRESVAPNVVVPNFVAFPFTPSHISHMVPKATAPSFFMPDELRMEILRRHSLTMTQLNPEHFADVPVEVDNYHNLLPLENLPTSTAEKSSAFGYVSSVYKANNNKTGVAFCLRRIHGFRLVYPKVMAVIDMWKKTQHSNIVQLREVFTTKAFGDHCIVFVYDYHPGAETLMSKHFSRNSRINGINSSPYCSDISSRGSTQGSSTELRQHAGLLPESLIWAYIVQLCSAMRTIHTSGLACQSLHPSKILLTGKSRIRINCCGIYDVLAYDPNVGNPQSLMSHFQQEDLTALGKLVLALACNSLEGVQHENIQSSMDLVARNYSSDLRNLVIYLLANQNRTRSVNDIMPMIGARFFTQLDAAQMRSDVLENELAKEVECGRLFRLLAKMGVINERPEFNLDESWSETGDRYMLKLFRDYLFHQVTEDGRPWIDMAHIVQCLNKLDAGVADKITLMSRDETHVLVVSYAELKKCMESSFNEIRQAMTPTKET